MDVVIVRYYDVGFTDDSTENEFILRETSFQDCKSISACVDARRLDGWRRLRRDAEEAGTEFVKSEKQKAKSKSRTDTIQFPDFPLENPHCLPHVCDFPPAKYETP